MADTKISALSAASALDGTEVLPADQSATTVKATTAQIKTMVRRAGSSTAGSWPIMGSGTVLATPVAGAEEFDGTARYFTPAASSRAVDLCEWFACTPSGNYALGNNGNQQKLFNVGSTGALTLVTGLYFFEMLISVLAMDAVNATNATIDIVGATAGGTATCGSFLWHSCGIDGASATAANQSGSTAVTAASTSSIVAGVANATLCFNSRGTFRCTVAGTIIPSITLLTAAAASIRAGSFFRCRLMGSSSVTTVGNWA